MLLLFAASHTLPGIAASIESASLAELVGQTLVSFQDLLVFREISFGGIVEAARRVLRAVWERLQQQQQQQGGSLPNTSGHECQPARATTAPAVNDPISQPGLSLYCPPFTRASDLATAIPTASTMDSFVSFPTPNSPHLFSFSALTSPQHSPSISATSTSPSPRSSTFVSPSRPFHPKTAAGFAPGPHAIPPSATFHVPTEPLPPFDVFRHRSIRSPATFADFPGFVHHLGLGL